MKAVILVGGKGTRLYPITCDTPKAMVPILNKPFLEYQIRYLKKYGVEDIILAMGYLPEPIQNYFGDGSEFGVHIVYLVEERPLGTAGAVKNAETLLGEPFFALNGDVLTGIDLAAMVKRHREIRPRATIALTPVEDPTIYGVVETDANGMVKRFVEKPSLQEVTTNMINAGIYILEPEILTRIPKSTFFMFEHDIFPSLLEEDEPISSYPSDAYWIDIGTPEKYLRLHHDLLLGEGQSSLYSQGESSRHIRIESESKIHPEARIEEPVLIGRDCIIAKGARVKGPAVLGVRCEVAEGAVVEGAVIWHDSKIGKASLLKDCIVASSSCIEDGCYIPSGCVVGDNVVIGEGSRLARQTRIWPDNYFKAA
ncbi:MAG: NDP-sugar synthase [Chloroflexota bacterium]|nr:NDP-sugar synthase [Chloroflexota bacterium]